MMGVLILLLVVMVPVLLIGFGAGVWYAERRAFAEGEREGYLAEIERLEALTASLHDEASWERKYQQEVRGTTHVTAIH
jgi:hypothetical protein